MKIDWPGLRQVKLISCTWLHCYQLLVLACNYQGKVTSSTAMKPRLWLTANIHTVKQFTASPKQAPQWFLFHTMAHNSTVHRPEMMANNVSLCVMDLNNATYQCHWSKSLMLDWDWSIVTSVLTILQQGWHIVSHFRDDLPSQSLGCY